MDGEISLDKQTESRSPEEEHKLFEKLEERIHFLLIKFQELEKERDRLVAALGKEREKVIQLERNMKLLSQDREKVKMRIDQLLHRFKSIDS